MSSYVSEFIINPVLRQARRFSEISRSTFAGDGDEHPEHPDAVSESSPVDSQSPPITTNQIKPPSETPIESPCQTPVEDPADSRAVVESPLARPLSVSTQETRIEDPIPSPIMADASPPHHNVGITLSPLGSRRIPEDDGMRALRRRIQSINAQDISSSEKARLMHETLLAGYRASRTIPHIRSDSHSSDTINPALGHSPSSRPVKLWQAQTGDFTGSESFVLSEEDIKPSFVPVKQHKHHSSETVATPPEPVVSDEEQPLGCQHYERNVKLQCSTCKKWYTCRFCHDANEDHNLVRTETKNMLCMICATPQKASDVCMNCGEIAAHYYCNICKLWENRQHKPIYHCNECGICRRGMGLGKDFFHCKTCRACIAISIESSHKCIERSTDCDCPICGEYLFTSPRPVVFMACGHSIHKKCYDQHMKVSYKCPICNKSLANMESQFRNLDVAIQAQPMPPDFQNTTAVILCNDCSGKSTVRYHWLGLKCSICRSYNTVELQILGPDHRQVQPTISEAGEPVDAAAEMPGAENARPIPISTTATRANSMTSGRRRHSSFGIEAQYQAPERVARSVSPLNLGFDSIMGLLTPDGESDDDILGIWRTRSLDNDESGSNGLDEFESDDEDSDAMSEAEEEEDDDANEIFLIGHR
ncbi:Fc.00g007720.m01.CDS01 [Cosmosporella sp. VM-42]